MKWQTDEEKEFKLKYFENKKNLTVDTALYQIINGRLKDLENTLKTGEITKAQYDYLSNKLLERKKWAEEVDKELQEVSTQVEDEISSEIIAKEFSANKVKSKLKDIRNNDGEIQ